MLSTSMFAQSNKEDVDLIQSIFGKEKKELVQVYMTIPEAQSAKFWSLYDEYETARKKLGQERIKLIEEYATNYEKLDSKKASDLVTKKFAWADKYTKFQQSYFTNFLRLLVAYRLQNLYNWKIILRTVSANYPGRNTLYWRTG
jgi:hypothetical protein